jgi:hypothetical protein
MRVNKAIKIIFLILVAAVIIVFLLLKIFGLAWIPKALFETTFTPKKAIQTFESGRYGSWDWTPDGKIIYVKGITMMSHVKSAGQMGYTQEGAKTIIAIIDKDGTNNRIIKEIEYLPKMAKRNKRYTDIEQEERKGKNWIEWFFFSPPRTVNVEKEVSDGTIDKIYPDLPLSHIGWIDWNKNNNKLVFVANDGKGKTGIAFSDPEFREVQWINYEGTSPSWSPNGKWIVFIVKGDKLGNKASVWIMNPNGANRKKIYQDKEWFDSQIMWFTDNKTIFTGHNEIIDINGKAIGKLSCGDNPSISPNGQWVIHNQGIMNLETGEKRGFTVNFGFPKWSPAGKHIITGWEGGVNIFDFDNNRVKNLRKVTQEHELPQKVINDFYSGQ